ncbi:hypothetical protein [Nocardioides pakistanensis]
MSHDTTSEIRLDLTDAEINDLDFILANHRSARAHWSKTAIRQKLHTAATAAVGFREDVEYQVVGPWGVGSARDEADAIHQVMTARAAHLCDGYESSVRHIVAERRRVRRYTDDSEWYGPWEEFSGAEYTREAVAEVLARLRGADSATPDTSGA